MSKYCKKPVVIEAIQYFREENIHEVQEFFGDGNGRELYYNPEDNEYYIKTLEGDHKVSYGDFIIRGINGEFYPCKPDIFEKTYEKVEYIMKNEQTQHPPNQEQIRKYQVIRDNAKDLAYLIDQLCPNSREKSLAMAKLEEAVMWANAAIARKPLSLERRYSNGN